MVRENPLTRLRERGGVCAWRCGYVRRCVLTVRRSRARCQPCCLSFPVLTVKAAASEFPLSTKFGPLASWTALGSDDEPKAGFSSCWQPRRGKFHIAACAISVADVLGEIVLKFFATTFGIVLEDTASIVGERMLGQPPCGEGLLLLVRKGGCTADVKVGTEITINAIGVELRDGNHRREPIPAVPVCQRGLESVESVTQGGPSRDSFSWRRIQRHHGLPVLTVRGGP